MEEETSFSGVELAGRARVAPEVVARLVELGILRPRPGEAPFGLGDEQALPMELVQRVHEASGLGRPQPDDPIHPLDRDLLGSAQLGRMLGLDDGVLIRIAGHAGSGQVLVSDQVVAECPAGPVGFEPIGPVALKGVADPVPLHRAARKAPGG